MDDSIYDCTSDLLFFFYFFFKFVALPADGGETTQHYLLFHTQRRSFFVIFHILIEGSDRFEQESHQEKVKCLFDKFWCCV